jgi:tRNA A-37 threonylcarbamoyl transferase component Bud32
MSSPVSSAYANWEPPSPDSLQAQLFSYDVVRLLGKGGMGAVYEGRQRNLDRRVAIKLMPRELYRSEEGAGYQFEERFHREAKAMARLDHPSIVGVYDFGKTAREDYFLAMEFVDGMDIHHYLHTVGGKLGSADAAAIVSHVLDALAYAHEHGIVHRDIKPANVLINRAGKVKVADFGLAKRSPGPGAEDLPILTLPNMAMGTPDYAAPEITKAGATPDHRIDLYAVGVMFHELLTGEVPRGRWRPPSDRVEGIDPRLDKVVEKALQSEPADRYATAQEFRKELDLALAAPLAVVAEASRKPAGAAAVRRPIRAVGKADIVSGEKARETEEEPAGKPVLPTVLAGVVPLLAIVLFLVFRGQKTVEVASPVAEIAETESSPARADDAAATGERRNEESPRGEASTAPKKNESTPKAPVVAKSPENPESQSQPKSQPPKATKPEDKPSPVAATEPKRGDYSPVTLDEPGPPVEGRWRPLLDDRELLRDGLKLENGDAFLAPCMAARVQLDQPIDTVLLRWRGFRGNSMSVEYTGSGGEPGRRSNHVGSGGGTQAHLGPSSGPGAARSFDTQWYLLIQGKQKHQWEVHDGHDYAVSVNFGEEPRATDIKELRITTWNPHHLPYFKPALIRSCDILIPTGEQLAEILAARTTGALLDLPWVAFSKDEAYDAFLDAVDQSCEKLAAADFHGTLAQAGDLLAAQPLLEQNPHREILESVRDTAAALIALGEAAEKQAPWPDLKDNRHYRLDRTSGHAFVSLPLLLSSGEAAAFAEKTPGHLATLAPKEDSQRILVEGWLLHTTPLGIVTRREGRFVQGWHLGGAPRGNGGWTWITGESLPTQGAGTAWRERHPGYDRRIAALWVLGGTEAENQRQPSLGWETVSEATRSFALLEFPAPATRYPNPRWNHPVARTEAPGSTGDPLVDFENRFTYEWREAVTIPWAIIDRQLRVKYSAALETRARTVAQGAALDAVLPWYFEIKTVREGGTPPPLDAGAPEALRQLRAVWDTEAAKVAARRETFVNQAIAAADAELTGVETLLTQAGKIDPAAAVQARRKQLAAREALPE